MEFFLLLTAVHHSNIKSTYVCFCAQIIIVSIVVTIMITFMMMKNSTVMTVSFNVFYVLIFSGRNHRRRLLFLSTGANSKGEGALAPSSAD